jgi:hypothetical protein
MIPAPERPPVCLGGRQCRARPTNRTAHHRACPVAIAAEQPPLTFRAWLLASDRWRYHAWANDRRVVYYGTPEQLCLYRSRLIARGFGAYETHLREAWSAYAEPLGLPVPADCGTPGTRRMEHAR